jgi:hypothetical protein
MTASVILPFGEGQVFSGRHGKKQETAGQFLRLPLDFNPE